jgi:hypothetical protein
VITFLAIANAGYADFAKNLIANFREPFLKGHRLDLHCIGPIAYEAIRHQVPPNVNIVLDLDASSDAYHCYGTPGFNSFTQDKFRIILTQLQRSTQIWYVDCDVAIFADPGPFASQDYDIVFQTDASDEALAYEFDCVCTGNFLLTNNQRTMTLLEEVLSLHSSRPDFNDQDALHAWGQVRSLGDVRLVKGFNFEVFNPRMFMNGYFAFERQWLHHPDRVMIHANFVVGSEPKRQRLELCGGWFPSQDPAAVAKSRVQRFLAERGFRDRRL